MARWVLAKQCIEEPIARAGGQGLDVNGQSLVVAV